MSRYYTIDPNESLTFFMGSWRDMYLNESEFSESEMSSEGGGAAGESTSSFSSVNSGSFNNSNSNNNSNNNNSRSLTKVATLSSSRNKIPDDWFNEDDKTNSKKSIPATKNNNNNNNNNNSNTNCSPRKTPGRSKSLDPIVVPIIGSPKKLPSSRSIASTVSTISTTTSTDNSSLASNEKKVSVRRQNSDKKDSHRTKVSRSKSSGEVDCDNNNDKTYTSSVPLITTKVTKVKKTSSNGTSNTSNGKDKNKIKFHSIININPYNGEIITASKIKNLLKLLKLYPQYCMEQYTFTAFPDVKKIYPFHMLCAIAAPISCIKKCYKNYPSAINDDTSELGTAIHYACAFHYNYFPITSSTYDNNKHNKDDSTHKSDKHSSGGNTLAVVQYLVKKHANMLRVLNKQNLCTALHLACAAPYFKAYSAKLDDSSNSIDDNNNSNDDDDCTEQIVTYLTSVCKKLADVVDQDRNTALHIACSVDEPSITIIQHLCTIAPQTTLTTNKYGSTPMHLLVDSTNNDTMYSKLNKYVKILIRTNDTSLRILDRNGDVPLHIALRAAAATAADEEASDDTVGQYNIKVIKQLIKAYPESIYVKNQNGHEPYNYGKLLKLKKEIVDLLKLSNHKR